MRTTYEEEETSAVEDPGESSDVNSISNSYLMEEYKGATAEGRQQHSSQETPPNNKNKIKHGAYVYQMRDSSTVEEQDAQQEQSEPNSLIHNIESEDVMSAS